MSAIPEDILEASMAIVASQKAEPFTLIEKISRAILAERERSRWLTINEDAKQGQEVLVSDDSVIGGNMQVVFYANEEEKTPYVWQTTDGISYHEEAFTHWMPLPSPPKP